MALKNWSTTAGSNATVDSINWAENQAPSTVNDSARALMSDVRTWYNDLEWRDWGHTVTQTSATTFTVATDVTAIYVVDQPIRCTDSSTLYGKVTARSYSAPNTTVTVSLDSGSLSASLTAVSLGQKPTGKPIDVTGVRGAVANTGTETIAGDKTFTGNNTHSGTQTISGTVTMSGKSLWTAEGASVASASSTNIWATDGNFRHITGTATINDFATAPQAGAVMGCIADGAFTLADSATIIVPGNANFTAAADDTFEVYAETTTTFRIINYQKADGTAIVTSRAGNQLFTASGSFVAPTNVTEVFLTGVAGGGGGGGADSTINGGGGGSGSSIMRYRVTVTPGSTYTVTIGAAGAGGPGQGNGTAGGDTIFQGLLTLGGGGGGAAGQGGGTGGAAGTAVSLATLCANRSSGVAGTNSGAGASSFYGNGGALSTAGTGNGSGGGGGTAANGGGAAGTIGFLLVEWNDAG